MLKKEISERRATTSSFSEVLKSNRDPRARDGVVREAGSATPL
jgi:hypothetical protein